MSTTQNGPAITHHDLSKALADLQPPVAGEAAGLLEARLHELGAVSWPSVWATTEMAHLATHTIGQVARLIDGKRAMPESPLGTEAVEPAVNQAVDCAVIALRGINARVNAQLTQRAQHGGAFDLAACQADLRMLRVSAEDTMVYIVSVVLGTLDSIGTIPAMPTDARHALSLAEIVTSSLAAMDEVVTLAVARFEGLVDQPPKRSFWSRLFSTSSTSRETPAVEVEQAAAA